MCLLPRRLTVLVLLAITVLALGLMEPRVPAQSGSTRPAPQTSPKDDLEGLRADMKFFTDPSCSQLKTNVRLTDLPAFKSDLLKTVAAGMLDGTYDRTFRAASPKTSESPGPFGACRGVVSRRTSYLPAGCRPRMAALVVCRSWPVFFPQPVGGRQEPGHPGPGVGIQAMARARPEARPP